jgi:hypothetical protein
MFHLVSLVPLRGVIVACCLDCMLAFVFSGVVKLLLSLSSFLKTKKKKSPSSSLEVVTKGTLYLSCSFFMGLMKHVP